MPQTWRVPALPRRTRARSALRRGQAVYSVVVCIARARWPRKEGRKGRNAAVCLIGEVALFLAATDSELAGPFLAPRPAARLENRQDIRDYPPRQACQLWANLMASKGTLSARKRGREMTWLFLIPLAVAAGVFVILTLVDPTPLQHSPPPDSSLSPSATASLSLSLSYSNSPLSLSRVCLQPAFSHRQTTAFLFSSLSPPLSLPPSLSLSLHPAPAWRARPCR